MKAEKILLPPHKKRLFLWKNFNPRSPQDIEKVLNSLKHSPPNSFREAWRWFHLFQETSNAVTEVQNLLELQTLRVADKESFQRELQDFESTIFRRLLESRQELMDVYMNSPFRSSMHPDDNGRIMAEFQVREPFVKPELAQLQVEENNIVREYRNFIYQSRVVYDGRSLSLSTVVGKLSSTDASVRKSAFITVGEFYRENASALEELFSKLLENRNAQADICSLDSYAPIAFADLGRFDYGAQECAVFRAGIEKELSQGFGDIEAAQCQSLEQSSIRPWDVSVFPGLIPQQPPCGGNIRRIRNSLPHLLREIHPCFAQLCEEMIQRNLVDILPRHGKGPGAFCMTFPESQMPFIFANLGGSWKDVLTLIHEFGHAAHGHACVTLPNVLLRTPGMEFCEFASNAMELLALNHMGLWTETNKDLELLKGMKSFSILTFLPFMAILDEWQHVVYTDKLGCAAERNRLWESLEDKYRPWVDWSGYEEFKGYGWLTRPHIFTAPFYYIDYGIAQMGAVQLWENYMTDPKATVESFIHSLGLGAQRSLPDLFKASGVTFSLGEELLRNNIAFLKRKVIKT